MPRRNSRFLLLIAAGVTASVAVAQTTAPAMAPATTPAPKPAPKPATPAPGATPNAERVVTIAALDKRTGVTRSFEGKPGEEFRFGDLAVVARSCETTPPWESRLTGAFLQIDEVGARSRRRVYSGWMFAQSPSLNPLEHPRYDVWVKACAMTWPETGPDTVAAGSTPSASRSSAPKSAATPSAPESSDR